MRLYIVATPIGNLKDITLRALDVLRDVDYIAAEDTRVTRKLLARYDIHTPLISFHEHSLRKDLERIIRLLKEEKSIAYVTDAGTPGISDPGSFLVREVSLSVPDAKIEPLPGPSALTAALSVAGLLGDSFLFLGFPPVKKGRKTFFAKLSDVPYPVVLYESPHRLLKTVQELYDNGLSMFNVVLLKEISKVYETIIRMNVEDLLTYLKDQKQIKGEFVLVIHK